MLNALELTDEQVNLVVHARCEDAVTLVDEGVRRTLLRQLRLLLGLSICGTTAPPWNMQQFLALMHTTPLLRTRQDSCTEWRVRPSVTGHTCR